MKCGRFMRGLAGLLTFALSGLVMAQDFTMTILHFNDTHGWIEPSRVQGRTVGGFSRMTTEIRRLRTTRPNPIVLHAGDVFAGTLYFNVYTGMADLSILNYMGVQAMAVGNHEFDKGPQPLADFARLARFPLLAANLDLSREPRLQGLVSPSTVLTAGGQRIGVVGSITPDTPDISSPGDTVGFKDYATSVQAAVNALEAQGINKIVLLSHSGFDFDRQMTSRLRGIDVVVGGHSHTLLGKVDIPGFDGSRGDYPTRAVDAVGREVLIVQAWEWAKVLGELQVTFNAQGHVIRWGGGPRLIDESIPEDPFVKQLINAFGRPIEQLKSQVVGESQSEMTRRIDSATGSESTMGYVIADAALAFVAQLQPQIAFWNNGGVRAPLDIGPVTYGELATVCPFANTLVVLEVTGAELRAALSLGIDRGSFLIPSRGFAYQYDLSRPEGQRLVAATLNGQPVADGQTFRIVLNSFIASGGDAYVMFRDAKGKRIDTGFVDLDALIDYFRKHSPIRIESEGRVKKVGG